jgi:EpsI family protein
MVLASQQPTASAARTRAIRPAAVAGGVLLLTALAVSPTLAALESFWREIHDYRHGYLVAAVVVGWLFNCRSRLNQCVVRPSRPALMAFGAALLCWLVAFNGNSELGQQLLVPPILWLGVFAALGGDAARAVLLPLAFLIFAIPVWDLLVPLLQRMTVIATETSLGAGGVPVIVRGSRISIPEGTFSVVEGCSGKHYLVVCLAVASLAVAGRRLKRWRCVLVLAIAAAVALLGNWFRVIVIVIAGHVTNMRHYLVTVDHVLFGNIVFAGMLAIILGSVIWVTPPPSSRAVAGVDTPAAPLGESRGMQIWPLAAIVLLLSAAAGGAWWGLTRTSARLELPPLPVAAGNWRGPLPPARSWWPHYVGAADERRSAYSSSDGTVETYVNVYARQRQGRELIYFENSLLGPGEWQEVETGSFFSRLLAGRGGQPATVVAIDREGTRWAIAYVYAIGSALTASDVAAQVLYGARATLGDAKAGVVAAAARCDGASCSAAQHLVALFWTDMSPSMLSMLVRAHDRDVDAS